MSFELDLSFGKIYEKKLLDFVKHDKYNIKEGYFPYYDVEITNNNETKTYECKADRIGYKTGNMTIEFEHNGRNSGINITTSDYYAYFVVRPYNVFELYIIPTQQLKDDIANKLYKRVVIGGSNKKTKMYMFDFDIYNKYKVEV